MQKLLSWEPATIAQVDALVSAEQYSHSWTQCAASSSGLPDGTSWSSFSTSWSSPFPASWCTFLQHPENTTRLCSMYVCGQENYWKLIISDCIIILIVSCWNPYVICRWLRLLDHQWVGNILPSSWKAATGEFLLELECRQLWQLVRSCCGSTSGNPFTSADLDCGMDGCLGGCWKKDLSPTNTQAGI